MKITRLLILFTCALLGVLACAQTQPRATTKYSRYLEAHWDVGVQAYTAFSGPSTYTRAANTDDAIAYIPDLSGKGRNLAQATANNKPLYKPTGVGGKPGMLMDSTTARYMDSASGLAGALDNGATIFVVYSHGSTGAIKVVLGTAADKFYIARNSLTDSVLVGGLSAGASTNFTNAALGNTTVEAIVYDKAAGKLKVFRNLALTSSVTVTGTANFGTGVLRVGDVQTGGTFTWPGLFAEAQLYSRAFTDAEVRSEMLALMDKYGLNVRTLIGEGHSMVAGYKATYYATTPQDSFMQLLDDWLPSTVTVKNYGVAGAVTADALTNQATKVMPWVTGDTIVLYMSGINDAKATGPSITAATALANIATYVRNCRLLGAKVLISTVSVSNYSGQPTDTNTKVAAINAGIRLQWPAWGATGIIDVDADPKMGGTTAYNSSYFDADLLHYNALGHARYFQIAKPIIGRTFGINYAY